MDSFIPTYKHIVPLNLLLSGLLVCVSFASHAEQQDMFFDNQIVPTVLSAAKLPQLQTKAPASITVIDRELIKASGVTQVSDIFRLVPGMHVGHARGNFPVVAYQGLTSEFSQGVQVIIDGSSVYSPLFGGVIWSTLPITLEDIERIEIVRGPNSVSFGANAFQSVINITTTHAAQPKGTTISLAKGSHGFERSFARYAGSIESKPIDYRISLTNTQTYGYSDLNDDFDKQEFSTRIDYSPNSYTQWQLSLSALDSTRQTQYPDASSFFIAIDPKRDRNESSQYAQLKWGYSANDKQSFNSQLSFHHFDGKDKYYVPIINELDITGESTRWNADFEHSIQLNTDNRAIWGLGAVHESVYSPFRLNSHSKRSNTRLRLFGNLETQLSHQLSLNTGAVYEHSLISSSNISPRIALNYSPNDHHGYRLIATRAFRTPVITEEYRSSFVGNVQFAGSAGDLEAETIDSIELGYHGIYWNNSFNIDIKLYKNRYKKLIDNSIGNAIFIDNDHHADSKGVELEINYRPDSRNLLHAGYAYTNIDSPTARFEISAPTHNLNVLYSHKFKNALRLSTAYYNTSGMQYIGSQNDYQNRFERLDLTLSKLIGITSEHKVDISLTTQLALSKNIDFHNSAVADNQIYLQVDYRAN